jgi:hypothetical protein
VRGAGTCVRDAGACVRDAGAGVLDLVTVARNHISPR